MAANKALTVNQIAGRILERDDNDRKKGVIRDIINMYMEECRKALINGERIQLSGIGTIIPELKVTEGEYHIPKLNKDINPPYTTLRIYRNNSLKFDMNKKLQSNVKKGIFGLEELELTEKQLQMLKDRGYIECEKK